MLQNLLEKLQLKEEKNLLIQGLPSSIEKQFVKLAFAKNVTPLLKIRKIDFALVFALSESQLKSILREVLPALHNDVKFWIAYPKVSSKITTDLNRDCSWDCLRNAGYEGVEQVALDHVWTALQFRKTSFPEAMEDNDEEEDMYETATAVKAKPRIIVPPADLARTLRRSKPAFNFFEALSASNKKEYVDWINGAKTEETRSRRIEQALNNLKAGKNHPNEK